MLPFFTIEYQELVQQRCHESFVTFCDLDSLLKGSPSKGMRTFPMFHHCNLEITI